MLELKLAVRNRTSGKGDCTATNAPIKPASPPLFESAATIRAWKVPVELTRLASARPWDGFGFFRKQGQRQQGQLGGV